MHISSTASWK